VTQKESKLSSVIRRRLRNQGCFVFKVWGSDYMMAGLPDLIGCYKGYFFGLEVKREETREKTSVRQEYVLSLIRAAGGVGEVVCSPDEAWAVVRAIPDRRGMPSPHDER
jgi:Holliday junction resolvase